MGVSTWPSLVVLLRRPDDAGLVCSASCIDALSKSVRLAANRNDIFMYASLDLRHPLGSTATDDADLGQAWWLQLPRDNRGVVQT